MTLPSMMVDLIYMQQILLHVGVWLLIITLCALVIGLALIAHLTIQVICIRLTDQHIYNVGILHMDRTCYAQTQIP